jgi:hypothetical protein
VSRPLLALSLVYSRSSAGKWSGFKLQGAVFGWRCLLHTADHAWGVLGGNSKRSSW